MVSVDAKHRSHFLTSTLPDAQFATSTSPTPDPIPFNPLRHRGSRPFRSPSEARSEKSESRQRISLGLQRKRWPRLVMVMEIGVKSGLGMVTRLRRAPLTV